MAQDKAATATTVVAHRLTKDYGEARVVDNLDLKLKAGEIFGLLGPNGAGKTTTILMLLGLVEPTAGSIEVLGLDPSRHPLTVKRRVGYLPDAVGFYDGMTGWENLSFTAQLNRLDNGGRVDELLDEVGLAEARDQKAGTYSRGMKQRLGIADALLKDPDILILDEPTTAIDPEGVAEILSMIRRLADERGVTVLLSSHLLHQVQAVCDRVAIFVRGKVVAQGAPSELASRGGGPEEVEFNTPSTDDKVRSALGQASFVKKLESARIRGTYVARIDRGSTNKLVSALVNGGVQLDGIRRTSDDLDEVYRRYFHQDDQSRE
ncbi:MAG TPA: ABC transporter ATP-binding protein [Acidimicrobiia bacterium]|nr:ABC transporter ATP-binding protein [Acidimicrobiia bacterium]